MDVHEVARRVMKDKKLSQGEVAARAGMKGQSAVGMWLSGKSMRVDNLLKILDACGYDLIVKDRSGENQSYRISDESGEDIVIDGGLSELPLMATPTVPNAPAVPTTPVQPMAEKTETQEELIRRIVQDELRKAGVVG